MTQALHATAQRSPRRCRFSHSKPLRQRCGGTSKPDRPRRKLPNPTRAANNFAPATRRTKRSDARGTRVATRRPTRAATLRRGVAHTLCRANCGHHHRVHFQYSPRRTHTASKYWRQARGKGMQGNSPACRTQFHRTGTQLRARIGAHAYRSSRAIHARCCTLPKCLQCIRKARHTHWTASITHMVHHQAVRAKSRQGPRRDVQRARNIRCMQCPATQR